MSTPPCFCSQQTYEQFIGDAPRKFASLVEISHKTTFPDVWQMTCSVCGTRWRVSLIPYGGIYGDFEWERLPK